METQELSHTAKSFNSQLKYLVSTDGKKISYQVITQSISRNDRWMVIVHGGMEHPGRYRNVFESLKDIGFTFVCLELRGHGSNSGRRGDGESFSKIVSDLKTLIQKESPNFNGEKPFLLGHSLGGLTSLLFLRDIENRNLIRGAVISAPYIWPKISMINRVKEVVARVALKPLFPELTLPVGLPLWGISSDPEVLKDYKEDPLVFDRISMRFAVDVIDQGKALFNEPVNYGDLPIIFQHGEDDPITLASGTEKYFNLVSGKNKVLKVYKGFVHEPYNESIEKRTVALKDLRNWVKSHIDN